jgi:hypothetical protein
MGKSRADPQRGLKPCCLRLSLAPGATSGRGFVSACTAQAVGQPYILYTPHLVDDLFPCGATVENMVYSKKVQRFVANQQMDW